MERLHFKYEIRSVRKGIALLLPRVNTIYYVCPREDEGTFILSWFVLISDPRYHSRPRFLKGTASNRVTDGGDIYRQWLKKECFEGRGSFIPRDAEETKRLQKFKARVRDLTLNVALGKLCIAQYKTGMHVKALDEWTVRCDLCDCS